MNLQEEIQARLRLAQAVEEESEKDVALITYLNEHARIGAAGDVLRRMVAAMPEQPSAKKAPAEWRVWRNEMDAIGEWAVQVHNRAIEWQIKWLAIHRAEGFDPLHYLQPDGSYARRPLTNPTLKETP